MKKSLIGILIFTLICVLSISVFAADTAFTDDKGHWAQGDIEGLRKDNIASGYEDNTFRPDEHISRAEFVAMIVKACNPSAKADISKYTDIPADAWYYDYFAKAVAMGIVQGYSDTTMQPEATISRQEAMVVLARLLKLDPVAPSGDTFIDEKEVAGWAAEYVQALVSAGYVNGYEDGSVRPANLLTRAECAKLIHKGVNKLREIGVISGDIVSGDVLSGDQVKEETKPSRSSGGSSSSSSRNDKVAEIIFTETEDAYTITASGDKASNNNTLIVTVVALDGTETTVSKNKLSSAGYANDLAAVAESDALNAEKLVKTLVSSEKYYNNGLARKWGSAVALKLTSAELAAGQPVKDSIPEVYEAIAGVHGEGTAEYIKGLAAEQATVAFTAAEYDDVISTLASL